MTKPLFIVLCMFAMFESWTFSEEQWRFYIQRISISQRVSDIQITVLYLNKNNTWAELFSSNVYKNSRISEAIDTGIDVTLNSTLKVVVSEKGLLLSSCIGVFQISFKKNDQWITITSDKTKVKTITFGFFKDQVSAFIQELVQKFAIPLEGDSIPKFLQTYSPQQYPDLEYQRTMMDKIRKRFPSSDYLLKGNKIRLNDRGYWEVCYRDIWFIFIPESSNQKSFINLTPFWISKYEISNKIWHQITGKKSGLFENPNKPFLFTSAHDALQEIDSFLSKDSWRLQTYEEWMKLSLWNDDIKKMQKYPWGDTVSYSGKNLPTEMITNKTVSVEDTMFEKYSSHYGGVHCFGNAPEMMEESQIIDATYNILKESLYTSDKPFGFRICMHVFAPVVKTGDEPVEDLKTQDYKKIVVCDEKTPIYQNYDLKIPKTDMSLEFGAHLYVYKFYKNACLIGNSDESALLKTPIGWIHKENVLHTLSPCLQNKGIVIHSGMERQVASYRAPFGGNLHEQNVPAMHFFYVFQIKEKEESLEKWYLLGKQNYLKDKQQLLGWIKSENIWIWPTNMAVYPKKQNSAAGQPKKFFMKIYGSLEDLLSSLQKTVQPLAYEPLMNDLYPEYMMRFPVQKILYLYEDINAIKEKNWKDWKAGDEPKENACRIAIFLFNHDIKKSLQKSPFEGELQNADGSWAPPVPMRHRKIASEGISIGYSWIEHPISGDEWMNIDILYEEQKLACLSGFIGEMNKKLSRKQISNPQDLYGIISQSMSNYLRVPLLSDTQKNVKLFLKENNVELYSSLLDYSLEQFFNQWQDKKFQDDWSMKMENIIDQLLPVSQNIKLIPDAPIEQQRVSYSYTWWDTYRENRYVWIPLKKLP